MQQCLKNNTVCMMKISNISQLLQVKENQNILQTLALSIQQPVLPIPSPSESPAKKVPYALEHSLEIEEADAQVSKSFYSLKTNVSISITIYMYSSICRFLLAVKLVYEYFTSIKYLNWMIILFSFFDHRFRAENSARFNAKMATKLRLASRLKMTFSPKNSSILRYFYSHHIFTY